MSFKNQILGSCILLACIGIYEQYSIGWNAKSATKQAADNSGQGVPLVVDARYTPAVYMPSAKQADKQTGQVPASVDTFQPTTFSKNPAGEYAYPEKQAGQSEQCTIDSKGNSSCASAGKGGGGSCSSSGAYRGPVRRWAGNRRSRGGFIFGRSRRFGGC